EVQDGQHGSVARRVQELIGMPARRQRARLSLAIAHDTADQEVRIIKSGTIGVRDRVSELAALMNGPRSFGGNVARDAARKRKLPEELLHSFFRRADIGIKLAIRSLEVRVRHQPGTSVTGAGNVDRVQIVLPDEPVEMDVDEVETRGRAPV